MLIQIEYCQTDQAFFCLFREKTFWGNSEAELLLELAKFLDPKVFLK
jgi:hypothetical protein|tara:strand:+ start:2359 stop:2499 length:141 start_codon:yes stop_codon:yes gene_type:complete